MRKRAIGRPKEKKRVVKCVTILPSTVKSIRKQIVRGDKDRNTAGKIIDSKFKP